MLASHQMELDHLIVLACPVHQSQYWPNFGAIQRVVSFRVRCDLVLLADRASQRFRDSRVEEPLLDWWFSHSAPHTVEFWRRFALPNWF